MKYVILIETNQGLDASMTGVIYKETLERAKQVRDGQFARFHDIGDVYVCEIRDTLLKEGT